MCQMWIVLRWLLFALICLPVINAVTMEQFEQSMDMMRNGCAPKFKIPIESLNALRNGKYEEIEGIGQDIRCYTKCVAQLAGILTKKGDFSSQKAVAQIPIILPVELQDRAKKATTACKDVQKDYKESCDRVFYTTKCVRDFDPEVFKFP